MGTDQATATADSVEGYVDLYLLPVPEQNLDAYRQQAITFGRVAREHGAVSYRGFLGNDLRAGFNVEDGRVLTAAAADFTFHAPTATRSWRR